MSTTDRKEKNRTQLREEILTATKLLYANKGNTFTMQEVADQVGIAKGSVYLHFSDKEALMEALVVEAHNVVRELITVGVQGKKTGMDRLMAMGASYIQFYRQFPQEFSLVGALDFLSPGIGWNEAPSSTIGKMVYDFKEFIVQEIRAGIADGSVRPDIDTSLGSLIVSQTVMAFVQKIAQLDKEGNLLQITGFDAETLIQGLFQILKRAFEFGGQS